MMSKQENEFENLTLMLEYAGYECVHIEPNEVKVRSLNGNVICIKMELIDDE